MKQTFHLSMNKNCLKPVLWSVLKDLVASQLIFLTLDSLCRAVFSNKHEVEWETPNKIAISASQVTWPFGMGL